MSGMVTNIYIYIYTYYKGHLFGKLGRDGSAYANLSLRPGTFLECGVPLDLIPAAWASLCSNWNGGGNEGMITGVDSGII